LLSDALGFKREEFPGLAIFIDQNGMDRLPGMTAWHAPKNGPPKHSNASRELRTNPGTASTLHALCKFQFPVSGICE
jgi:hypothetical protein